MNTLVISLGSNSPDREWQMRHAIERIKKHFSNVKLSDIYETPEHSGKYEPYLNCVIIAETNMELDEANKFMKQWESLCGRTPNSKLIGVIPIDLDIVIWNYETIRPVEFGRSYFQQGYIQLCKK